MARLFIYDSNAVVDANGAAVAMSLQNNVYRASQPVRLYGAVDGAIHDIGYEMLFDGSSGVATAVTLYWYQEFFNDAPSRTLPSARTAVNVPSTYGWCREQLQYGDGSLIVGSTVASALKHYDIRREVVLADGTTYFNVADATSNVRCLYFPCRVHALFTRLKLAVSGLPASGSYRLRAWAIVGGQDQQAAQESQDYPYVAEL